MATSAEKNRQISQLRKEYTIAGLHETDLDDDPFAQFEKWFQQALDAGVPEPTAMTLATATKKGKPSARIVLLKNYDDRGFVFFTNYDSHKGRELMRNPAAASVFHWVELERQVRIVGTVERTSRKESGHYFRTRPVGSQLGAWASKQSDVIPSREVVETRARELAAQFENKEIPLPPFWGGFRIKPTEIEFWQGRPNRLHDRFRYSLLRGRSWRVERLSP
jgi:pyridoxamine 5'-phosphate oxidase